MKRMRVRQALGAEAGMEEITLCGWVRTKRDSKGFSFLDNPNSLLMINWMAIALRTDSSVGVVMASSYALVCSELQLS